MSVPEGERGENKFNPLIKSMELAMYTIQICNNKNIFLPEYQSALTDDIIRTAKDIYIDAWTANNIRVINADNWKERRCLQERAKRNCNNLLALIQLAKGLYHLKDKRVKYWGRKTLEVRKLLQAWKESDGRRYSKVK